MTSLEQLSLAEFSGEYARSKVYENDHRNVLGIWLDISHSAYVATETELYGAKIDGLLLGTTKFFVDSENVWKQ